MKKNILLFWLLLLPLSPLFSALYTISWPKNPAQEQVINYSILEYNGTNYTKIGSTNSTNFVLNKSLDNSERLYWYGIVASNVYGFAKLSELTILPNRKVTASASLTITKTSDNLPQINFFMFGGVIYELQYTYNFTNWSTLSTFKSETDRNMSFVDTSVITFINSSKFYRLCLK